MDKKNNIIKDELEYFQSVIDKKKKRNEIFIIISTILLVISIFINHSSTLILMNVAAIGILMINRSCIFSLVRNNDKGEKIEFIVGILLVIISIISYIKY